LGEIIQILLNHPTRIREAETNIFVFYGTENRTSAVGQVHRNTKEMNKIIRVKFQELIIGRNEEAFRRHNDENVQRDSTKEEKEASQQRQAWRSLGGFFSTGIIDSLPGVSVSYEEQVW
jgi:hypothetical protein